MSSNNGSTKPKNRLDAAKADDFPKKPRKGYSYRLEFPIERVIAWTALDQYHGEGNGKVKERDRSKALSTRNAIIWGCDVDRARVEIAFARGWMSFTSGEQIDHLLACFEWQLSDKGPGIALEDMVIADEMIEKLKVLSAKAEADKPKATKK